jgi:hypothetical protein
MAPIIHFGCPGCDGEIAIKPAAPEPIACPHCKQDLTLPRHSPAQGGGRVTSCICCGHSDLYVQKDFNRRAGLTIVVIGVAFSLYFFSQNEPMRAMGALGITALVDFLVYFLVGDVTVCYSCHAIYRGFERNPEHEPFDLKKLEKYGGRSPRSH